MQRDFECGKQGRIVKEIGPASKPELVLTVGMPGWPDVVQMHEPQAG
jgi:hypothetical protein